MKNLVVMFLAVVMIAATGNANDLGRKKTVIFKVNMTCGGCISKLEKNIAFEKGVKNLKVNLEKKTVEVTYLDNKTNVENLTAAFTKLGFTSSVVKGEKVAKAKVKAEKAEGMDCCGEGEEMECTGEMESEGGCCGEAEKVVKKKIKK